MSTVETIRFRLRAGVAEDAFMRHNREVQEKYMARRPGFLSRETGRADNGDILVIVHWATTADADATIKAFFGAPETQEFLADVDADTVVSGRYELVES